MIPCTPNSYLQTSSNQRSGTDEAEAVKKRIEKNVHKTKGATTQNVHVSSANKCELSKSCLTPAGIYDAASNTSNGFLVSTSSRVSLRSSWIKRLGLVFHSKKTLNGYVEPLPSNSYLGNGCVLSNTCGSNFRMYQSVDVLCSNHVGGSVIGSNGLQWASESDKVETGLGGDDHLKHQYRREAFGRSLAEHNGIKSFQEQLTGARLCSSCSSTLDGCSTDSMPSISPYPIVEASISVCNMFLKLSLTFHSFVVGGKHALVNFGSLWPMGQILNDLLLEMCRTSSAVVHILCRIVVSCGPLHVLKSMLDLNIIGMICFLLFFKFVLTELV